MKLSADQFFGSEKQDCYKPYAELNFSQKDLEEAIAKLYPLDSMEREYLLSLNDRKDDLIELAYKKPLKKDIWGNGFLPLILKHQAQELSYNLSFLEKIIDNSGCMRNFALKSRFGRTAVMSSAKQKREYLAGIREQYLLEVGELDNIGSKVQSACNISKTQKKMVDDELSCLGLENYEGDIRNINTIEARIAVNKSKEISEDISNQEACLSMINFAKDVYLNAAHEIEIFFAGVSYLHPWKLFLQEAVCEEKGV